MERKNNDEKSKTWNGKIGLITSSDYIRSNSDKTNCGTHHTNKTNYVECIKTSWMDSATEYWWSISPTTGANNRVLAIHDTGYMGYEIVTDNFDARPAIYLSANINLTGTGTQIDPYRIIEGVSTTTLEKATFTEEGLFPKTVTHHFTEGCGDTLTCSYQQDNGQAVNVTT